MDNLKQIIGIIDKEEDKVLRSLADSDDWIRFDRVKDRLNRLWQLRENVNKLLDF